MCFSEPTIDPFGLGYNWNYGRRYPELFTSNALTQICRKNNNILNANDTNRRENHHSIIRKASFAINTFQNSYLLIHLRGEWTDQLEDVLSLKFDRLQFKSIPFTH